MILGIGRGAEVPAPGAFSTLLLTVKEALHGDDGGGDDLAPVGLDAVAVSPPVDDAHAPTLGHQGNALGQGLTALQAPLEGGTRQGEIPAQGLPAPPD